MEDHYFTILFVIIIAMSIYMFVASYLEERAIKKKGALWRTIKGIVTSGDSTIKSNE